MPDKPKEDWRIASLPRYGPYPVPYMFYWRDGVPDFKVLDYEKIMRCAKLRLCGICAEKMGRQICFVGGPGSIQHRIFHDPPYHRSCAEYAFCVCPYLLGRVDHRPQDEEKLAEESIVVSPVITDVNEVGILTTETYSLQAFENRMLYFRSGEGPVDMRKRKHA